MSVSINTYESTALELSKQNEMQNITRNPWCNKTKSMKTHEIWRIQNKNKQTDRQTKNSHTLT